jgi:septum formation protein
MLVLASASPRRQELLRNARIRFAVQPADIPEIQRDGELSADFARRLAREKAQAAFDRLPEPAGALVLGADTIVVVDGEVLGKPASPADAFRMLRRLSGRWHDVITGVCLCGASLGNPEEKPFADVRAETTRVQFLPLTDEDIRQYIATGEPMDKAGAYAIQGVASRWAPRIEGDYFNVMGLPVSLVCRMLREWGGLADVAL